MLLKKICIKNKITNFNVTFKFFSMILIFRYSLLIVSYSLTFGNQLSTKKSNYSFIYLRMFFTFVFIFLLVIFWHIINFNSSFIPVMSIFIVVTPFWCYVDAIKFTYIINLIFFRNGRIPFWFFLLFFIYLYSTSVVARCERRVVQC